MSTKMHITVLCYLYDENSKSVVERHVTVSLAWHLTPTVEDTVKVGGPGFSFLLGKRIHKMQANQAHAETGNAVVLSSPLAYEICIHSNLTGSSPLA